MNRVRRIPFRRALAVAFVLAFAPGASAQTVTETPSDARLQAMEDRIRALETQLAARTPPAPPPATVVTTPAAAPEAAPSPYLDVRDPPFGHHDWSWTNGSNYQPASLLRIGPVTPSFGVDSFYAFQFSQPIDHTIFLSSTAPRHNEIGLDMAWLGLELNGVDTRYGGPIGRVEFQYGLTVETNGGQDSTVVRGFYLSDQAFKFVKQAAAGWHFHWLHGVNLEVGIFPSYIALESYVPQENWNYTHPFVSDFTPYYFAGVRSQIYLAENLKLELWLVNGWQTYGQWHEARAGGYLVNWRPNRWLSLTHTLYFGQEDPQGAHPLRSYTDNYAQVLAYENLSRAFFQRLAFCVVADVGYEDRGERTPGATTPPSGILAGASLTGRVEWTRNFMTTVRGDIYYDHGGALVTQLPSGSPYHLPGNGNASNPYEFLGGGFTATMDWRPSPWLLVRLEYARRAANQPYFSGSGGITGPHGLAPANDAERASFTPDLRNTDDRIVANVTLRM